MYIFPYHSLKAFTVCFQDDLERQNEEAFETLLLLSLEKVERTKRAQTACMRKRTPVD